MKAFKSKLLYFRFWIFAVWAKLRYTITMRFTRNKSHVLPVLDSINQIPNILGFGKYYRSDPLKGKFDIIYHPRYIQKVIDKNFKGSYKLDCDEHAIFWVAALLKSNFAKRTWLGYIGMESRITKKKSYHMVCVFENDKGEMFWADYSYPKQFYTKWEWANRSADLYGANPFVACMFTINSLSKYDTPRFGKIEINVF